MASVFGDESADETKQRVFAVAGLIGTDAEWANLETAWVGRTGGKVFHAAECETEYANDPDLTKHKKNLKLYADLTQVISKSAIKGYGAALDIAAWNEFFPDVPRDVGYYRCFGNVITYFIDNSLILGNGEIIKFTFDHRQESEYNSGLIYDYVVNLPEWKEKNLFLDREIRFASRHNPRIQTADLVARETMKHLDNIIGPVKRKIRKSMSALASTNGRIKFEMYTREYCEDRKRQDAELQAKTGLTRDMLAEWLRSNRLADNMSNRMRFLNWIEMQDKKSGV